MGNAGFTDKCKKGSRNTPLPSFLYFLIVLDSEFITIEQTSGRTEHHGKLHVLISAEIREHKLAGQTLLLA